MKNFVSVPVISKVPSNLELIEFPILSTTKLNMVSFGSTIELKIFSTTAKWCHNSAEAVTSIKVKGDQSALVLDFGALNFKSTMLSRKNLARLPSFLSTRLPSNRRDLKPGTH